MNATQYMAKVALGGVSYGVLTIMYTQYVKRLHNEDDTGMTLASIKATNKFMAAWQHFQIVERVKNESSNRVRASDLEASGGA